MQIIRGEIKSAQKVVIYGPEGIGKSTFASQFPNPIFIDTEGSTKKLNVARTPKPSSWTMLLEQVKYFKNNPKELSTLVIDTADWAEILCISELCSKSRKSGIEDFGYGKGYVYLAEEFGRLLNLLEEVIEVGVNVVFTAHAQMRKFEQPDEMGAYDRWEMKLQKKTAPLLREWADTVLFANYKTYVVNVDGQGVQSGKNKAQGGKRVMYTTHHNCWDAKNRDNLKDELSFSFDEIAHIIPAGVAIQNTKPKPAYETLPPKEEPPQEQLKMDTPPADPPKQDPPKEDHPKTEQPKDEKPIDLTGVPKALADLMAANKVTVEEIQQAVASKGYYPQNTPISNYDPEFISGVLVGAWPQVFKMIEAIRNDIPF
ncbi:ATP-binding protein [Desulfosporosinus sp. FKA]|uniref:ATP-binding protein n=1 Tax=Desulfosporosinus sp. FKA TaxID=1969834 RepID=UPI000B4A1568|nr:ATP-binding protein [Desulfosporosinus sp. FKA]